MVETMLSYVPKLVPYLSVTLHYVALSLLFGTLLALVLLGLKLCRFRALRGLAFAYTTVMRCTPSIVMLFLVYYALPVFTRTYVGVNIDDVDAFVLVVVTFTMFLGGSLSELLRSAYLAVDHGQFEAAECCGLTRSQATARIVAPQMLYLMIPNIGNTLQFLIKEGSLVYMIGVIDIVGQAYQLNGNTYGNDLLEIYLTLAIIFWVISIGLEQACRWLERHLGKGMHVRRPGQDASLDKAARAQAGSSFVLPLSLRKGEVGDS